MNYNQELKKWREERDITIDSQKRGLVSNLLEEITEVSRAQDLDGVVDGLLDYSVFLANALEGIDLDQELTEDEKKEVETKKTKYKDLDDLTLMLYKDYFISKLMDGVKSASFIANKRMIPIIETKLDMPKNNEEMKEELKKLEDKHLRFLNSLYRLIKASIMIAGYDFDKAFNEVFKAIHSRKGKWDNKISKFVKDPNQTDRYEPNYENAKIK
jgi:hypothetical protein|nr:MAG TPA: hypothetical protein [Caudoviricetes sp.]